MREVLVSVVQFLFWIILYTLIFFAIFKSVDLSAFRYVGF